LISLSRFAITSMQRKQTVRPGRAGASFCADRPFSGVKRVGFGSPPWPGCCGTRRAGAGVDRAQRPSRFTKQNALFRRRSNRAKERPATSNRQRLLLGDAAPAAPADRALLRTSAPPLALPAHPPVWSTTSCVRRPKPASRFHVGATSEGAISSLKRKRNTSSRSRPAKGRPARLKHPHPLLFDQLGSSSVA